MQTIIMMILLTFSFSAMAECVHEKNLSGLEILNLEEEKNIYVLVADQFLHHSKIKNIGLDKIYQTQELHYSHEERIQESVSTLGKRDGYNRRYVEYYEYQHMVNYITNNQALFHSNQYHSKVIGKSLGGRNLYAVLPDKIDPSKKTIIMFGRHHGDEGTANWIIEGFLNKFFAENHDFQLIIYPMVNPDGAEDQVRYNRNNRDLNRVWHKDIARNYDEVKTIHQHLAPIQKTLSNIPVVLDMHGSFTEDFIFRVNKRFKGVDFYNKQQAFISHLGGYDPFQAGNFQLSDGHPKMARIMMVREYSLNALTHESVRNIRKGKNRSIQTLKEQGEAVYQTIYDLY